MPEIKGQIATLLNVARKEVNVQEEPIGSNDGPRIRQYLAVTGLGGGYYWCAAFASWCGLQAARIAADDDFDAWPLPASADCDVILFKARKLGITHTVPAVGDLFLVMASQNDATHIGIVTAVNSDGSIQTIEGNSNDGGSNNGYKVAARSKRSVTRLLFVRWIDSVEIPGTPWRAILRATTGAEKLINTAFLQDGYAYIPVRRFLKVLGLDDSTLEWNDEAQGLNWYGRLMPVHISKSDGVSWGRIRQLVAMIAGLDLTVDTGKRLITVFRK